MTVYIIAILQTHKDDNVNMFVTVVMVVNLQMEKGNIKLKMVLILLLNEDNQTIKVNVVEFLTS